MSKTDEETNSVVGIQAYLGDTTRHEQGLNRFLKLVTGQHSECKMILFRTWTEQCLFCSLISGQMIEHESNRLSFLLMQRKTW